jgi:hypothetical protein
MQCQELFILIVLLALIVVVLFIKVSRLEKELLKKGEDD